jgi:hypothetical protein
MELLGDGIFIDVGVRLRWYPLSFVGSEQTIVAGEMMAFQKRVSHWSGCSYVVVVPATL